MKTILVLLISVTCCLAQENYKGRIIKYFDKNWEATVDPASASYFRTVEDYNGEYMVRDYYSGTGQVQMEAVCHAYTPDLFYHGKATWYYENGNIKEEATYAKNERHGPGRTFYRNGKVKEDLSFIEGVATYNHVYDFNGQDILVDGSGVYADTLDSSNSPIFTDVVGHKFFASFAVENADTIFMLVEKPAEYKGGLEQLGADLGARLKYPRSARRSGHSGVVYVVFVVNKKGEVIDPRVLKGIHPDCDAEALRVVKTLSVWQPGEYRGKKVKSRFVLPIRFRLTS